MLDFLFIMLQKILFFLANILQGVLDAFLKCAVFNKIKIIFVILKCHLNACIVYCLGDKNQVCFSVYKPMHKCCSSTIVLVKNTVLSTISLYYSIFFIPWHLSFLKYMWACSHKIFIMTYFSWEWFLSHIHFFGVLFCVWKWSLPPS